MSFDQVTGVRLQASGADDHREPTTRPEQRGSGGGWRPVFGLPLPWGVLMVVAALAWGAADARADVVVYSNLATDQGRVVSSALPVWDDLTIVGGGRLSEVTFRASNLGAAPRGFTAFIEVRTFNEGAGSPGGVFLGGISVDRSASQFAAGLTPLITLSSLESLEIDLPADSRIGVGIIFHQTNWGMAAYDPPTVGSSADAYWLGFNPSPINPAEFVANFAWELAVVPEPAGGAAMLLGCAWVMRRRARGR